MRNEESPKLITKAEGKNREDNMKRMTLKKDVKQFTIVFAPEK